ncbi:MAG: DNA protecting protein DprA [Chloroflexi bacterium RBG_16_56_11]|nr:MAG: DNA protecting protein DprA [Chloroflexi bacterium RBG_16_56_11]
MNTDTQFWVAFNNIPGIGRVRLAQLESYFGGLEQAWKAPAGELRRSGLDNVALRAISQWRDSISPEAEMAKLEKHHVRVLTCNDASFPARLKEIYDFPPVLYLRGSLLPEDEWCLAVVGTRRATVYGKQVTAEIVSDLARSRITIVSGLARGIDTIAHRSALEAGGRTLAVFACGLDTVYPAENEALARQIMENGALLSEYPLGSRPRAENFPRRNRILSGLSLGVLVTEAGEDSGAMITARMALEQNREVFAIPGSILSPASRGTNRLIRDGEAKLVREHSDILEELNLTAVARQIEMREVLPTSDTESVLLRQLSAEPVHIDEICRLAGLPAATVSGTLAMMELKGMVKQVGTMNYILAREMRQEYKVRVE